MSARDNALPGVYLVVRALDCPTIELARHAFIVRYHRNPERIYVLEDGYALGPIPESGS